MATKAMREYWRERQAKQRERDQAKGLRHVSIKIPDELYKKIEYLAKINGKNFNEGLLMLFPKGWTPKGYPEAEKNE